MSFKETSTLFIEYNKMSTIPPPQKKKSTYGKKQGNMTYYQRGKKQLIQTEKKWQRWLNFTCTHIQRCKGKYEYKLESY